MPGNRGHRSTPSWPWLVGALVLLLLLWAVWEIYENPEPHPVAPASESVEPTANSEARLQAALARKPVPMPPPPSATDDSQLPVSVIVVAPSDYIARAIAGTTRVAEEWGNRGFWVEQGGQRLFVLLHVAQDTPQPMRVRAGQQLRISGVVYSAALLDRIQPAPTPEVRQLLADQPAFLLADPRNVQIIAPAPVR